MIPRLVAKAQRVRIAFAADLDTVGPFGSHSGPGGASGTDIGMRGGLAPENLCPALSTRLSRFKQK